MPVPLADCWPPPQSGTVPLQEGKGVNLRRHLLKAPSFALHMPFWGQLVPMPLAPRALQGHSCRIRPRCPPASQLHGL